jgi:hypothetical protein
MARTGRRRASCRSRARCAVYVDSDNVDVYQSHVSDEDEDLVARFVEEDFFDDEVLLECLFALLVEEL